ncbi:hypothetical protein FB007_13223 [Sinorhizobium medicae]|nr:hypothetical protein FB007_13223 [Sinorhizobium medicae]
MKEIPWRVPLSAKLQNGIERRFCGPYDALDFLEHEWPNYGRRFHRRQRLPCGAVEPSDGRGRKAILHRRLHRGVHAVCGGSSRSHSGFDEEYFCALAALIFVGARKSG